jgi:hypothetical protein
MLKFEESITCNNTSRNWELSNFHSPLLLRILSSACFNLILYSRHSFSPNHGSPFASLSIPQLATPYSICLPLPNVSQVVRIVILRPEGFLAYRRGEDVFKKEQKERQSEIKENIGRLWYACDAKGKHQLTNTTVRFSCMKMLCLAKLSNCLFVCWGIFSRINCYKSD